MTLLFSLFIGVLAAAIAIFFNLLSADGALLAAAFAFLLLEYAGPGWFAVLFSFFLIGAAATFVFSKGKSRRTLSQSKRGWKNIAANGAVALFSALSGNLPAFVGSVSAVTADTVSCEIGELSKTRPRLITTLKPVKTGTNGGVTLLGEAAGFAAAAIIGVLSYLFLSPDLKICYLAVIVGFLGTNFDSLLGAIFENKGKLTNHEVNFLTSVFAALLASIIAPLL